MTTDRGNLAVVIGRAGSKGLPGKNTRLLAGRPLICHTLEAAVAAQTLDRVVVSTDGDDIAAAASSMSVPVVNRPPELATDTTPVDAAVRRERAACRADRRSARPPCRGS